MLNKTQTTNLFPWAQ